jgi:hypothetical protein
MHATILLAGCIALHSEDALALEEPTYQVEWSGEEVELRRYAPSIVAETQVEGEREEASREGFRRLARYIFGGNRSRTSIAMTAPVAQSAATSERIAMTAPVAQSAASEGTWTVQFTMPAAWAIDTLPTPEDDRVLLRELPERRVLVLSYRGGWSEGLRARKEARLQEVARERRLEPVGALTWARYDPPWTLWFLKRNELWVGVR